MVKKLRKDKEMNRFSIEEEDGSNSREYSVLDLIETLIRKGLITEKDLMI